MYAFGSSIVTLEECSGISQDFIYQFIYKEFKLEELKTEEL